MKRFSFVFLVAVSLIILLVACGGKVTKETPFQEVGAPDWVKEGSGAFDTDDGKVFHGVGSAVGIKNFSLLRTTADNRARADLAKIFEFYTSSLMKDYMASTMAGDTATTSEEQHVEQAIKTVTSMTLSGVQIIDHWQHPSTGELYSLAKLDLEEFKDGLKNARDLNNRVRDYIRQNADKLHEELKEEEEKMEMR